MKLSSNTRYAVRILMQLQDAKAPTPLSMLSAKTGIALRTVENVHTILKQHGVTDAVAGAKGGIRLARPLDEVSLGQLVEWFDEGVDISVCPAESNGCAQLDECPTQARWRDISQRMRSTLGSISMAQILRQSSGTGQKNS